MEEVEIKNILKRHKLRITESRVDILAYFMGNDRALSFKDLEEKFNIYDRVTLYRTLNSFTDKGVLHKIPDESGYLSYGICYDTCHPDVHNHDHIHFKCELCEKVECLENILPNIQLQGYTINNTNIVINGICKNCNV